MVLSGSQAWVGHCTMDGRVPPFHVIGWVTVSAAFHLFHRPSSPFLHPLSPLPLSLCPPPSPHHPPICSSSGACDRSHQSAGHVGSCVAPKGAVRQDCARGASHRGGESGHPACEREGGRRGGWHEGGEGFEGGAPCSRAVPSRSLTPLCFHPPLSPSPLHPTGARPQQDVPLRRREEPAAEGGGVTDGRLQRCRADECAVSMGVGNSS